MIHPAGQRTHKRNSQWVDGVLVGAANYNGTMGYPNHGQRSGSPTHVSHKTLSGASSTAASVAYWQTIWWIE